MRDLDAILPRLAGAAAAADPRPVRGRIREIRGIIVHASLPAARIGELCQLRDPASGRLVPAEVIGFQDDRAVLTAVGDLQGLSARCEVVPTGRSLHIPVGEALLGRVIDPMGRPLDGGAPLMGDLRPVLADPPPALSRDVIRQPLALGLRAIDGLLTVARGQRVGIFGGPGVGKSSLLSSIIAGTEADVVVLGLVGERGREVRELLEGHIPPDARARTVAVVATSDRPAIERAKAAHAATTVAEYFRDRGRNVLLLIDSVTRFARAQREIGLAAGEPPTRRGFPPSFFSALPRLLERAGPGRGGSITGLYTVLTEGDAGLDPVAEEVMSILDGHVVLSAEQAQRGIFPAIDILQSRSRLMNAVASPRHRELASILRESLAAHEEVKLLLRIGEYAAGSDPAIDAAIARQPAIEAFLRQAAPEGSIAEAVARMEEICA
ncbi:FliI/YscN family ATPase [Falsirhodobacter sp. 20TX0035]|uniref:FliI/YscN family ATPase n=1 Tax=Falsirhodobacter sp. 20TX0035 TaxID=3022019 RepID=UPI002330D0BA|nr:FliI/YscN family ATPase [Falsirhodobacter sp. 20TX0035]MDB6454401.1 FliI/YscN family ATPase [Falsirhodobacter sp. 20TX0035]